MTDQQKKAVEDAADKMNIRPLSRLAFIVGAQSVLNNPEEYKLIDSQSYYTAIRESADLKENARLRGGLEHAIKALKAISSWGATTSIINTLEKALKGDNT